MQLDEIVAYIDARFAASAPVPLPPDATPPAGDWRQWIDSDEFQDYLQDQVNRRIVRDYLLNAIVLGFISPAQLDDFAHHMRTDEGRAALALHMLMSSVQEAADLPTALGPPAELQPMKPRPDSPPHMQIVPSWK
ncbi:MAG: hypothetical protein KDI01_05335 [Halioglobus sp.]|nr:hypothetical protein [Halioglobus sp.]